MALRHAVIDGIRRRMDRRWRWSCAIALSLLTPVASFAQVRPAPAPAPSYEEGQFDFAVTGLASRQITVLVARSGAFLLPVSAVLDQLGIPFRMVRDSAVAHVTRTDGAGDADFHYTTPRRLRLGSTIVPLDSGDVVVRDGEIFLNATRLALLVDGNISVDLSTLGVAASRPNGFPAQRRQELLTRREAQLAARVRTVASASAALLVPFEPRTGFGVLEWGLSGTVSKALPTAAETRIGMGLWGGMLKSRSTLDLGQSGSSAHVSDEQLSYLRVFPLSDRVRQMQLGDVISEGPLARGMRGITLTNAPFVRGLSFDEMPFSRPLPPGWEFEVYDGSRLVGFADAASTTPLRVPLQYGATPLRVRLYGPAGEVVESSVSYVIPVDQLRGGEWQYSAGAGQCQYSACNDMGYAELRHGVTRWLTMQGGLDERGDSVSRRVRPYGAVSFIPAPGWTTALQGETSAYLRGSVMNQGDGRVMGGVSAGVNAPGEGGTPLTLNPEEEWFTQANLQLRSVVPQLGDHTLNLSARADGGTHSGARRWDLSAVAPVGRILMEVALQSDPRLGSTDSTVRGGPMLRVAPTIAFGRGIWSQLGSPVVRVEGGYQGTHLSQWDVNASFQPGRSYFSLGVRQLLGSPHPELTMGGTISLGAVRVLTHLAARSGMTEGGYTASGAVAVGSVKRFNALEYGGLGVAGIEGNVFRDSDGDGQLGKGDVPVVNAVVQAGGLRTRTDAKGHYALWNVTPYEAIAVVLDTLSLEEPSWTTTHAERPMRLSPQQYTRVDFALSHTRELVGSLSGPQAGVTPGGVTVVLRDSVSKTEYETRTFSDGGFYLSQVRPGRYTLTVAESSLRALHALPLAVMIDVKGDADEVIEIRPVVLLPDPRAR